MSKRLIRVAAAEVPARLPELADHDLNVVLRSGHTYFGRLVSAEAEVLTLRDTRGHRHSIRVPELEEIIYDRVSPY